ncbi:MAG: ABC transporter permease [Rhodobacteraceae bacterium]|nr:ABC transporter permease [Paracoccaceae bacterium]
MTGPGWRAAAGAFLSHWRRHPGQGATLLLGLALATALWTGVQAINAEARASYDRAADLVGQQGRPDLVARDGGPIPVATYVALRRAGWPVAPILEGSLRLGGRQVSLLGLDPLTAPVLPTPDDGGTDSSDADALAAFIGPPGQFFGAPATLAALDPAPDQILISDSGLPPGLLVGDIATVGRLLQRPDNLSRLVLLEDPPAHAPPLARIAPGLDRREADRQADLTGLTGSFHLNLTAFGALSFAVGLFIVHGAVGLAFEQRRGMVRTLRALGLPARDLALLLAAELLCAALLAGGIGVGLGYVLAAALLPDVAATLQGLYGAPASGTLTLRPGWVAAGMGMALAGTALAAAQSLWRIFHLPVLAAAQPRAWRLASARGMRRQALLGVGLIGLAAALTAGGSGLTAGFALLGALLLGAALMLPPCLAAALRWAETRARHPLAQWFWADSRQQLPGLSLALMALLLALAANIGVSTMVGSFRATFTGWLDQRLAAEAYVNAGDAGTAARLAPWLRQQGVTLLPRIDTAARLNGQPGTVQGLSDAPTWRTHWPMIAALPGAWDDLAAGRGVFINEQLSHRGAIGPGGAVRIDGTDLPVLGVYSDYGNPAPEAVMGLDAFHDRFPDEPLVRFALRLPPERVADVAAALRTRFALPADRVQDQRAIKARSLEIFERTFAVTAALNLLTLGVAGLAIFTSLLTLSSQRLPQVAPVWAIGTPRLRLGGMELARAAALAGMTALLAVPVGLALAWILLAVVNVAAFGWRLPMLLFPLDWLRLGGLAVLAGGAAAALPALRLMRRPAADLLRVFAYER